jgi:V-type H+-transporting ATPase subunit d
MNYQFNCTENYGYLISKVYGKELLLLTEQDYKTLNQCENIEEFCIKLSRTYRYISEDMDHTKNELKRRLNKTLIDEYNECKKENDSLLSVILDYYIENHEIHNFFFLLQSKHNDPDLDKAFQKIEIGNFDALKTLKFCKDMHDVQKYCVENSFLKKYFYKVKWAPEFKDNDFQKYQALFLKYHVEDAYTNLSQYGLFIQDILKTEADRYIIDLTINTINSKEIVGPERKKLFPRIYSLDTKTVDELSNSESIDDIKSTLNDKYNFNKDIYTELISRELKKYSESFKIHNDISCVYSYLRLREQEIKNILWIVECVLQDRRQEIDHLILIN